MTITISKETSSAIAILSTLILLRIVVGFQHHSGQDNFHGSKRAYGGDYEAQRHWMELTLHLPMGDWYWYDLEYWGLDYPPLTAYVSWVCGYFSHLLVGPESVALEASRGYEDPTHKAYMRFTVLILDVVTYMSVVWVVAKKYNDRKKSMWLLILALAQPALILMDHGHFQYNTVSLGFALWGFYFCTKSNDFRDCIIGSVFFCLALNFKQMTLYYAPAIFAYLLGRCFAEPKLLLQRFGSLGVTVVSVFVLLWWPFIYNGPDNTTVSGRLLHILHRMFPFQRGLFEGKVANLWCALSVRPISIRERLPEHLQPTVALGGTLLLILPACYKLFMVGRQSSSSSRSQDWNVLLWGSASTALAFFLASFQVHEKSILMAVAPLSLLVWEDPAFINWFTIVSTWTVWPLLCVDRLQVAYFCVSIIYCTLVWLFVDDNDVIPRSCLEHWTITQAIVPLSGAAMVGLHVLEVFVTPPERLPDLFPVLWSIVGCGFFCISWVVTCWHLYKSGSNEEKGKEKDKLS